jgi:hypothetical protein
MKAAKTNHTGECKDVRIRLAEWTRFLVEILSQRFFHKQ